MQDSDRSSCPERRTALVAKELQRYNIDIAALSETRLAGEGQLTESTSGYTFFWHGKAEEEHREAGVGFAIRSELLPKVTGFPKGINERIMLLRLALSRNQYATIVSVYAPTMTHSEESKQSFYEELATTIRCTPASDKLILMGDFNARVGRESSLWGDVLGAHGIGNMNSSGLLLLQICQEFQLSITNTMFPMKNIYKGTWRHPRSNTWHLIDYVIVRRRDLRDVRITRVMRGADCWTDHRMVRSLMNLKLRKQVRLQTHSIPKRLNVAELSRPLKQLEFQTALEEKFASVTDQMQASSVDAHWETLKHSMYETALEATGTSTRRKQDWFDDNDELIKALLAEKHAAHAACIHDTSSQKLRSTYHNICSTVQVMLRNMRDSWWDKKAEELQGFADAYDTKGFYAALKAVYGPRSGNILPILSQDGQTLLVEQDKILNRWAEHFKQVLNAPSVIDLPTFHSLPQEPVQHELDLPPTQYEVLKAISSLKCGKAPGMDGLSAELLKAGGKILTTELTSLFWKAWNDSMLPQEFKDASIVHLYKRKGAKTVCDNHRGIALLSVPGKVLAKVLATRLYTCIAEPFLSESQCGFRPGRSCTDMIFTARQLMEKCREQHIGLCAVFVDLTKAFDSVNREGLWMLLEKRGCPIKFLSIVRAFHDGMCARVIDKGSVSDSFSVCSGVKQGCTMAPTLFAIYFAAMLQDALKSTDIGVYIQYRTTGKLFNLRRLQARTKVMEALIRDLLFADDCGLFTHTTEDMQVLMNCFADACRRFGLTISIKKTQVMYIPPPGLPYTTPVVAVGSETLQAVEQFTYLGSTMSSDCSLDAEITNRISKASAAFGALYRRLWNVAGVRSETKLKVYHAVVIPSLLYACETWTYYRRHCRLLDNFHLTCLKRILHIKWQDRITNVEVLRRANTVGMEAFLIKAKLRWMGHVVRMGDDRLPKQILYSQIKNSKRLPGGQLLRYKDNLRTTLKKCHIDSSCWEYLCIDRTSWRRTVVESTAKFEKDRISHLEQKRQDRKQRITDVAHEGVNCCSVCGKICLSRIGLFGHMKIHKN